MKTLNLRQGTKEWHAHRATHYNASDAPVMMGVSPYKSRNELIRERATGITPEIDAGTQRRFDDGHRFEALARPLAEIVIGQELYPCVGVSDAGNLSASFDGLTMLVDIAWEHKLLGNRLRNAMFDGCTGADLPEDYRVQMEQQLLVSGAETCLFMASCWDGDGALYEELHCWYEPDQALRERIIAAWDQFEADCQDYDPANDTQPKATNAGAAPDSLMSLSVQVEGKVLTTNLTAFRDNAMQVLGSINRDLKTDDDFANAEQTVKWCGEVETKLAATKANVLGQMTSIDDVCRTIDDLSAETRRIRLELDKLVKSEKESRKGEIVEHYVGLVQAHYAEINKTLGDCAMGVPASLRSDIGAAIKGKRTLGSITDAADQAAVDAKLDASQKAERIRQCIAVMDEFDDKRSLFPDRAQLCREKSPDDLRNLAKARVSDHEQREHDRLEAEREKIRAEEKAKAEKAQLEAEKAQREDSEAAQLAEARSHAAVEKAPQTPTTAHAPAKVSTRKITLGEINARIAPLSITGAGLESIGIKQAEGGGAAKLYAESDFGAICERMIEILLCAVREDRAA